MSLQIRGVVGSSSLAFLVRCWALLLLSLSLRMSRCATATGLESGFVSSLSLSLSSRRQQLVVRTRRRRPQEEECLKFGNVRLDERERFASRLWSFNNGDGENDERGFFDMSRPVFDIWTWRSIRNDALLRYNTLNQSEPLRISLGVFFTLGFLAWGSTLATTQDNVMLGFGLSVSPVVLSAAGTLTSVGLLIRELRRRSNQLRRLELELLAQDLPFVPPSTNPFAPTTWQDDAGVTSFRREQAKQSLSAPPRLVALYSPQNSELLGRALEMARVLRRRLLQANALVLATLDQDNDLEGWVPLEERRSSPFLARADNSQGRWTDFFDVSSQQLRDNNKGGEEDFFWFVLNSKGRSVASGRALETLRWMELLGTWLLPSDIFLESFETTDDTTTTKDDDASMLFAKQAAFYQALTTGDLQAMTQNVFEKEGGTSVEVQEIISLGGRLDPWNICLQDGARPAGMTIGDSDVCLLDGNRAYTTCLEFPSGFSSMETLLAVQRWVRTTNNEEWKLQLHQTIPWTTGARAGGTLLCDGGGCVALTASGAGS